MISVLKKTDKLAWKTGNADTQNILEAEQSKVEVFKATLRRSTRLGVPRGLGYVQEWEVKTSQIVTPGGNE